MRFLRTSPDFSKLSCSQSVFQCKRSSWNLPCVSTQTHGVWILLGARGRQLYTKTIRRLCFGNRELINFYRFWEWINTFLGLEFNLWEGKAIFILQRGTSIEGAPRPRPGQRKWWPSWLPLISRPAFFMLPLTDSFIHSFLLLTTHKEMWYNFTFNNN